MLAEIVCEWAAGGEVLVSSLLRELVESSGDFQFEVRRPVTLKSLSGRRRQRSGSIDDPDRCRRRPVTRTVRLRHSITSTATASATGPTASGG